MPSNKKPSINKKNGSQYWFLNRLIDRFYTSRFNRDSLCGLEEGEDIDNSRKNRLYNKSDVKEVLELFFKYLEWVIPEENIGKIYLSDCIEIERCPSLPRIKKANIVDVIMSNNRAKEGELYITYGKYNWRLNVTGEMFDRLREVQEKDPEFIERREELQKALDERNKNEGSTN